MRINTIGMHGPIPLYDLMSSKYPSLYVHILIVYGKYNVFFPIAHKWHGLPVIHYNNKKDTFLERNPNEAVAECQGRTRPII